MTETLFRAGVLGLLAAILVVGLAVLFQGASPSRGSIEIVLPAVEPTPRTLVVLASPAAVPASPSLPPGGPVNINLASQRQLEGLPGIGPELAAAIVEYRRVNGAYRRPEDLLKVPGIGERILAKVRPLVTVT